MTFVNDAATDGQDLMPHQRGALNKAVAVRPSVSSMPLAQYSMT